MDVAQVQIRWGDLKTNKDELTLYASGVKSEQTFSRSDLSILRTLHMLNVLENLESDTS